MLKHFLIGCALPNNEKQDPLISILKKFIKGSDLSFFDRAQHMGLPAVPRAVRHEVKKNITRGHRSIDWMTADKEVHILQIINFFSLPHPSPTYFNKCVVPFFR